MTALSDFIRPDIQSLTAYQVADLPEGFIKLDAMESPYHPLPIPTRCSMNGHH